MNEKMRVSDGLLLDSRSLHSCPKNILIERNARDLKPITNMEIEITKEKALDAIPVGLECAKHDKPACIVY